MLAPYTKKNANQRFPAGWRFSEERRDGSNTLALRLLSSRNQITDKFLKSKSWRNFVSGFSDFFELVLAHQNRQMLDGAGQAEVHVFFLNGESFDFYIDATALQILDNLKNDAFWGRSTSRNSGSGDAIEP